ncbi:50S ribosomal protein L15 [Leptospira harrisiae]|uniref:Large ribosomal subunit protein uL15 n=1 Tax=Leptospira harrisiae TaxID=2023189 RepID=A0A2N0APJ9_9LEPT|nr:50S ribosomal protein L15 [Leptospira harrisiae]PJZ86219.1 50S ribosomal protein L15 [Leptospira harrisiae]PKA09785.1 50S ribosomal protein L15 [Leptospira harrisiae]
MAQDRIEQGRGFGAKRPKKSTSLGNKNLVPVPEGAKTSPKRVGQGPGSGMGKTSTRGSKGQRARAASMRRGFEGGQLPLHRRLPKRGFTNIFSVEFQPVNLISLTKAGLSGEVTPAILKAKSLIKSEVGPIKLLGTGEVTVAITITVDAFSASAKEKIEKAGGKVIIREKKKEEKKN